MRVIFADTPDFAAQALSAIGEARNTVQAIDLDALQAATEDDAGKGEVVSWWQTLQASTAQELPPRWPMWAARYCAGSSG